MNQGLIFDVSGRNSLQLHLVRGNYLSAEDPAVTPRPVCSRVDSTFTRTRLPVTSLSLSACVLYDFLPLKAAWSVFFFLREKALVYKYQRQGWKREAWMSVCPVLFLYKHYS